MMARVLIVSDRLKAYGTFQCELQKYPEFAIRMFNASDLRFFKNDIHTAQVDLVILDVMGSQTKCLAALARVRALIPGAKIAVRTPRSWESFSPLLLKAGAHGIIDTSTYRSKQAMTMLIDSIMAGNIIYREAGDP